ncbi:hypothetical protein [Bacteroides salyersiae]|uniref:hypothetical protein n=1 Tax=Bacteroides salyersiae TaxID=291644 RepID=UPI001CCF274D|nr:hypothetical protein [Bacteroides salyersiae]UBD18065.1 hypothetical protein K6V19_09335 [Bacteroides salyersiae]
MASETKRKKTKICCLDLDKDCLNLLKDRFDVYDGSLGKPIDVYRKNHCGLNLLLNYELPQNIHEYDIFIEDMTEPNIIPYDKEENTRTEILGSKAYYFISYDPQTIFDPCPFGSSILNERIHQNRHKPAIRIAFQAPYKSTEYVIQDITDSYSAKKFEHNNYEHLGEYCSSYMFGSEVKLCDNKLSRALFESFLDDISYCQVFQHPTIWNENRERVSDNQFLPLLMSKSGSIVSYLYASKNDIILVLPQTKKKRELLQTVMQEFLYKYYSEYFPEVEESLWLNRSTYYLPGQEELLKEKEELIAKYNESLIALDERIEMNKNKYSFLHKLLTATGDELVKACLEYFKWLGFKDVIDKDKELDKEFNEEDIQINTEDKGLLLVEIKGINGTSTDAQCSQIFKNVFRRREEQQRFDVFGLYVVNNERGVEPLSRTIPPFNHQQIKDAVNEKRGLCYTWQLFNLYFEIEDGIITKQEAQSMLFNNGLIDFRPKVNKVAVPHKYYRQHTIVCLKIDNIKINVGDFFFYEEDGRWKKLRILTIKDGDEKFQSVSNGSYGFELERRCPNNKMLYIKL